MAIMGENNAAGVNITEESIDNLPKQPKRNYYQEEPGFLSVMNAKDVTKLQVNNALREMKRKSQAIIKKENITLRALFARIDLDND